MEQANPYISGIAIIKKHYIANAINIQTARYAHVIELMDDMPGARISLPGYKYKDHPHHQDFLIEFKHDDRYYKISYSDLALDIYYKIRYNPDIVTSISKFITEIGIRGDTTPIPEDLIPIRLVPPHPKLTDHIILNLEKHRLSPLNFGIPINYYPKILYWLGLNEEINYSPINNPGLGGRRTAFKRLIEAIYIAELSLERKDISIIAMDRANILLVLTRIKNGKCPDLDGSPVHYQNLFSIIDSYEHPILT